MSPGGSISVDGVGLECRWTGEAHDALPDIVLLHEGLGSLAMWKDFPDQLALRTGLRVFAYSRQGHGMSDPGPARYDMDYMHREALTILPRVLQEVGIRSPILVGHSDGGSIALIYAGAHPEHVSGLILEAPHVFVEPLTVESIAGTKHLFGAPDLRRKLSRYHRDVDQVFWRWNDIWLDPRFLAWNIEASVPRVRCPVLMVQGEDDEYGTRAQLDSIALHVGRPDMTESLVLPRCGHSPHRDQVEAVLAAISRFVQNHPLTTKQ